MTNFPVFYRNLFKVWNLFQFQRTNDSTSLHWLLEEPLVYRARLDLTSASASLTGIFTNAKVVTLRQLLNLAGPDFVEVDVVATKLGVRSTRMVEKLLQKIQACITTEEADLLRRYCDGEIVSCDKDVFPKLLISPNLEECGGIFLDSGKKLYMDFKGVNGKTLYKLCVKCFHKNALNRKLIHHGETVLGLDEVFYAKLENVLQATIN